MAVEEIRAAAAVEAARVVVTVERLRAVVGAGKARVAGFAQKAGVAVALDLVQAAEKAENYLAAVKAAPLHISPKSGRCFFEL